MVELKDTAIRLYRKYFGLSNVEDRAHGVETVLTGERAVVLSETAITQAAVSTVAGNRIADSALNAFGKPVAIMEAEGSRGALASAIGLSLAGRRAAAFVDGQEIAATQDLLYTASGRHLPLVIHMTARTPAAHGGAVGSGHEGFHLSGETGCFTLFAANVQEAADFTVIARRVAEQCLVPGVVAMDAEQTALSAQDVSLLSPAQLQSFIGPADGIVTVPTEAQKLLFGMQRRRVPRWHDVDRPVLQGALFGRESFALGALGRQAFFDSYLAACLDDTLARFAKLTGRHYGVVSSWQLDDADIVFVVQGSATETVRAAAGLMRAQKKARAGVLGLSSIRPLPVTEIAGVLRDRKQVVVLERVLSPPGGRGPLAREIGLALGGDLPPCHSVTFGLGGAPLRVADLVAIPEHIDRTNPSSFALGVDFTARGDEHPKREVLLDALERAYPGLDRAGLRAREEVDVPLPGNALAFLVNRKADGVMGALATEIAGLLHHIESGVVRGSSSPRAEWGGDAADYLIYCPDELLDPGDDAPADVLVVTDKYRATDVAMASRMRPNGIVVLAGLSEARLKTVLPSGFLEAAAAKDLQFFSTGEPAETDGPAEVEFVLGAVLGALIKSERASFKERKVLSARQDLLRKFPPALQEEMIDAFQQGFDRCVVTENSSLVDADTSQVAHWDDRAPATVRALGRNDSEFDSLPRFWDQVGVLYNDGDSDELTVDPYFATGTMAPLSATFRNLSNARSALPAFDPAACTGCGNCWTACPDSALGAVAISPSVLIDTGMRAAGADALRQVANQLSARIISQSKKKELAPTAGEVFRTEYEWLKEKMSMTPEREETLSAAIDKVAGGLDGLPLSVTDVFFHDAERGQKDSGELLAVVVNPDVCKGCGICVEQCEPLALTMINQNEQELERARVLWNVWAETPDTPAATIERVIEGGSVSPLAALNLSRFCSHAMSGGDSAEPGSGEKIALRMVLAATEFHAQPLLNRFAHDVHSTAADLVQRIQAMLASAMPGDDLDLLSRTLDRVRSPMVDLAVLAKEVDSAIEGHKVDTHALRRLTRLAEDLNQLHDTLREGVQGLGRARFGLAITPGTVARWAGEFPYNAFQSPVVVDLTGETPQIAAGLLEGHLRDTCEAVATLRRARLEVDQPAGIEFERAALDRLQWKDLTEDERCLCPPLVLVGNDEILAGAGLSQVLWLLSSDLPVKIVTLADLDLGLARESENGSVARHRDPRTNLALLAMAARNAYVSQTSIARFDHLQSSVDNALAWPGPALIRIHAPSPARHGVAVDAAVRQADLACSSRAYPLFTYDPRKEGVYGTRISLDANSDPAEVWTADEETGEKLTQAHWAVTEKRFASQFTRMADDDPPGVPLADFLELDRGARNGKTPMLVVGDGEGAERYAIGPELIRIIDEQCASWRVLQELAGIVTPFTDKVWEEARQGVSAEHHAELDALKTEYEEKISRLTADVQQEVAGRIRGQLANLVRMKSGDLKAENEGG